MRFRRVRFVALLCTAMLVPDAGRAAAEVDYGRYHALVIGNNAYQELANLQTAVNDASVVADLLRQCYGFAVELMLNASRYEVVTALNQLRRQLTEGDNLLVYYAGHGVLDGATGRGYWLPVDAEEDNDANWIANSTITSHLKAVAARHVLVVADSCYSGTLVRAVDAKLRGAGAAWLQRMAARRSRTALVSGGLEPVADGGGHGHSVFARQFIEVLRENREILDGQSLYDRLKNRVVVKAEQTPRYSGIRLADHDGGDFLFVPVAVATTRAGQTTPGSAGSNAAAIELAFWQSIQNSRELSDYEAYLAEYPDGKFARLARARIESLRQTQPTAVVPPPQPVLDVEPRDETLVALKNANVRAEPDAEAKKLDTLKIGTEVSVTGKVSHVNWYRIARAEGGVGYVYAPLLGEPTASRPTVAVTAAEPEDPDVLFWQSIRDSTDPNMYRAYLSAFPSGRFASLARRRIQQYDRPVPVGTPSTTKPASKESRVVAALPALSGVAPRAGTSFAYACTGPSPVRIGGRSSR